MGHDIASGLRWDDRIGCGCGIRTSDSRDDIALIGSILHHRTSSRWPRPFQRRAPQRPDLAFRPAAGGGLDYEMDCRRVQLERVAW